jgi:two-component system NtrC family sensor kinase
MHFRRDMSVVSHLAPPLLGAALCLAVFALLAVVSWRDRVGAVATAERALLQSCMALAERFGREVMAIDAVLKVTAGDIGEEPSLLRRHDATAQTLLSRRVPFTPGLRSLTLFDEHGTVVNLSRVPQVKAIVASDRDYFKAQRDRATGSLYITAPIESRLDGAPIMVFSRRIEDSERRFAGVIAAAVDLGHLMNLLAGANPGPGGSLALIRRDGAMLLRWPEPDNAATLGQFFDDSPVFDFSPASTTNTGRLLSRIDGAERIFCAQGITQAPLLAIATRRIDAVTEPWRKEATMLGGVALLVVLGTAAAVYALQRQRAAAAALERQRAALARAVTARLAPEAPAGTLALIAGGLLHDVGNIVSAIHGMLRLARTSLPRAASAHEHLDVAERAAEHATTLLHNALDYARSNAEARPLALDDVVRDVAALLRVSVPPGVALELDLERTAPVHGHPGQVFRAVANLVLNAAQSIPGRGHVRISLAEAPDDDGRTVRLTVQDDGTGIPSELLPHIFDPFFTTKRESSGLGLAVVASVLEAHDGTIEVASEPGKGTRFTLRFRPVRQRAAV